MEVYGTGVAVAALLNISIGVWIFKKDPGTRLNRRFLYATLLLAFWGCTEALTKFSSTEQMSFFWVQISYVPLFLFPMVLFHLAHRLSGQKGKIPLYASGVLFFVFMALLFTDRFIQGVTATIYGYEPVYRELFPYFAGTYMVTGTLGLILLYSGRMKIEGLGGIRRIDVMVQGFIITTAFVFIFELISPLLGWGLPKIGSIFTLFTTMAFKYAYVQYSTVIYPKLQRPISTKDAPCGALCSVCSSFLAGRCPSCAMGNEEMKRTCKIYECAAGKGITCPQCDDILTCNLYQEFKEECPFKDTTKCIPCGASYRIESATYAVARTIFRDRVIRGDFGLVVSREHPHVFFKEWDLEHVPVIWLSVKEESKWTVSPTDLAKLIHLIDDFIERVPVSCILFEGFEYLAIYNSFNVIMKLVYSVNDEVIRNKCRFLVSYDSRAFDEEDLAIMNKELKVLPTQYVIE